MEKDFLSSRNNDIFVGAIFLLVETIIGIWGKQFPMKELNITSGQLIYWLVQNHFFLHLSDFSMKPFISASENGFRAKKSLIKEYCFHSTAEQRVC